MDGNNFRLEINLENLQIKDPIDSAPQIHNDEESTTKSEVPKRRVSIPKNYGHKFCPCYDCRKAHGLNVDQDMTPFRCAGFDLETDYVKKNINEVKKYKKPLREPTLYVDSPKGDKVQRPLQFLGSKTYGKIPDYLNKRKEEITQDKIWRAVEEMRQSMIEIRRRKQDELMKQFQRNERKRFIAKANFSRRSSANSENMYARCHTDYEIVRKNNNTAVTADSKSMNKTVRISPLEGNAVTSVTNLENSTDLQAAPDPDSVVDSAVVDFSKNAEVNSDSKLELKSNHNLKDAEGSFNRPIQTASDVFETSSTRILHLFKEQYGTMDSRGTTTTDINNNNSDGDNEEVVFIQEDFEFTDDTDTDDDNRTTASAVILHPR